MRLLLYLLLNYRKQLLIIKELNTLNTIKIRPIHPYTDNLYNPEIATITLLVSINNVVDNYPISRQSTIYPVTNTVTAT